MNAALNDAVGKRVEELFKVWEAEHGRRLEKAIEEKAEARAKRRGILLAVVALAGPLGIGTVFWKSLEATTAETARTTLEVKWRELKNDQFEPAKMELDEHRKSVAKLGIQAEVNRSEAEASVQNLRSGLAKAKELEQRNEDFVNDLGRSIRSINAILQKTPKELSSFLEHLNIPVGAVLSLTIEDAEFQLKEHPGKWRILTSEEQRAEGSTFDKEFGRIPPLSKIGVISLPHPIIQPGAPKIPNDTTETVISLLRINP